MACSVLRCRYHMSRVRRYSVVDCGATVALHAIVGNAHAVQHLLKSCCSSAGNGRKHIHYKVSPVELLKLYREQLEMHTVGSILSRTIANLQGIVGNVAAMQHLLWSYCSSRGNTRKFAHCVASPGDLLSFYREYQEICLLCSISGGATVGLKEMPVNVHAVQHLLWSYCSLTGNSRKCAHCVASPVELLQLYREQYETQKLRSISFRAIVARQKK